MLCGQAMTTGEPELCLWSGVVYDVASGSGPHSVSFQQAHKHDSSQESGKVVTSEWSGVEIENKTTCHTVTVMPLMVCNIRMWRIIMCTSFV